MTPTLASQWAESIRYERWTADQRRRFDQLCREAYALLKLMKEGRLDHGAAVIAAWAERVRELEGG
jgi:hypothetical protein